MTLAAQYPLVEKALREFRARDYYAQSYPETDFTARRLEVCRILDENLDLPKGEKETLLAASILVNINEFDTDRHSRRFHLSQVFNTRVANVVDDYLNDSYNHTRPQDHWQLAIASFIADIRDLTARVINGAVNLDDAADKTDIDSIPNEDHSAFIAQTKSPRLVAAFTAAQDALRQAIADHPPQHRGKLNSPQMN